MDWQSVVPFIPFFASFFGVLSAFLLQWFGKLYDRRKDRRQFLKDIKHELEIGSTYLTGAAQLLPTDMWESGKASGFLSLLSHEVKTKLATVYFAIGSHNYESIKLREVSILAATTKEKPKAQIELDFPDKKVTMDTPWTPAELLHQALTVRLVDTEKGVKKLIDDLLKQDIWEGSEIEQTTGDKSQNKKPRKWLSLKRLTGWLKKGSNILALVALIISSIFAGITLWHDLYPAPQRAKFTVFLDNPPIWHLPNNVTEIDLTGRIVNEGSLTGQILRWDFFINMNMSYEPLFYTNQTLTAYWLKPEEECSFTLGRTLIGENNTRLPDNAFRSIGAWFDYTYQLDNSTVIDTAGNQVSYLP